MASGVDPLPNESGPVALPQVVRRSVAVAAVTSVTLILHAGLVMVLEPWYGLRRFGGVEYIPRIAGLSIVREWGGWGAVVVASLHVTALQHANAASGRARYRFAMFAGLAVPTLWVPVCSLALASSMAAAALLLRLPPRAFVESVEAADALHGFLVALALGGVPTSWSLLGTRVTRAPHRGLAFKLFVTWLVLLGVSWGLNVVRAIAQ